MLKLKSRTLVKENFKYTVLRWTKFFVVLGVAAFTLLLVISNVKQSKCLYKSDPQRRNVSNKLRTLRDLQCEKSKCSIFCRYGDISELNKYITKITEDCDKLNVRIVSLNFPKNKLTRNWIKEIFKIGDLTLVECKLNKIDAGAFNNTIYSNTTTLRLEKVSLQSIDERSFEGLKMLRELTIMPTNIDFVPKPSYLKFIGSVLEKLTIKVFKVTNSKNPREYLGTEMLSSVKIVDLSGNNFSHKIDNYSFSMLKSVERLLLGNCKITALSPNAFDSIAKTVTHIDLKWNPITTFPANFFEPLLSSVLKSVILTFDPLNCTCELTSFVEEYKKHPTVFEENLKCSSPKEFKGQLISEPKLCPISKTTKNTFTTRTTVAIQTTPAPTKITSTIKVPEVTQAKKETSTASTVSTSSLETPLEVVKLQCHKNLYNDYLEINPADMQFYIESVSPTAVKITLSEFNSEYSVVWYSNAYTGYDSADLIYNEYGVGCNARIQNVLILEDLKQKNTYVFCLIKIGEIDISPFNCHSHYMSHKFDNAIDGNIWLLWGSKTATFSIFSIVVLIAVVVGGVLAFYIIRWKPTLVKGSKRVTVVNKSTSDIKVVPRNSSTSSTETNQTELSNKNSTKKRLSRSLSEGSISSAGSYILVPVNPYESVQYEALVPSEMEKFYYDRVPKDPAPSIPKTVPNNLPVVTYDIDYTTNKACKNPRNF